MTPYEFEITPGLGSNNYEGVRSVVNVRMSPQFAKEFSDLLVNNITQLFHQRQATEHSVLPCVLRRGTACRALTPLFRPQERQTHLLHPVTRLHQPHPENVARPRWGEIAKGLKIASC